MSGGTGDRITLEMTTLEAIVAMSGRDVGALAVCHDLVERARWIDPQSALGGMGVMMALDGLRIYGGRIWLLYADVCGSSVVDTIGVLRAVQLGLLPPAAVQHAIDNRGGHIDVDATMAQVRGVLSDFAAAGAR